TVPVSASNFNEILGYQFTMRTAGLELTDVIPGALDVTAENVGIHKDAITMSWGKALAVTSHDVLFTLTFTAHQGGELSEMLSIINAAQLTEGEAYTASEDLLDVALTFRNATVAGKDFALFQNEPNPFAGSTVIGFTLPE